MKPIGPYVAARELPTGTNDSAVRTLRATDRLTGMPVLLHVLPYALNLPELPEHPNLLPFVDSGMDDQQAYMVTELPLQAVPATDATLAARGALAALEALHGRGLPHGGVSAAQLWSVDGRVLLTGAGLPWHDSPSPEGDLQALLRALDEIGLFPAALRPLRESTGGWDAGSALALLDGPPRPARKPQASAGRADRAGPPAPPAAPDATVQAASPAAKQGAQDAAADPQHDGTPIVLGQSEPGVGDPDDGAKPAPASGPGKAARGGAPAPLANPAQPAASRPAPGDTGSGALQPAPSVRPGAEAPADARSGDGATPSPSSRVLDSPPAQPASPADAETTGTAPSPASAATAPAATTPAAAPGSGDQSGGAAAPDSAPPPTGRAPVSPFSTAPAGAIETPQDRRRRQNEERRAQAMLDAQAAAGRRAGQLRADAAARQAEAGAVPPLIQIGFPAGSPGTAFSSGLGAADGAILGADDLPDWTPPAAPTERPEQDGSGPVGADGQRGGRGLLKMREVERLPESLRRPAEPEPEAVPAPLPLGRLPSRHVAGGPIRIGWDEDDSWRVVKTAAPAPVPVAARPPRWLIPALTAALLFLGLLWTIRVVASRVAPAAPAAVACCDVAFTLRGAAGATARLTVESAPSGANLTPGQDLGEAPGRVRFPVQGTYRLRVVAEGYESAALSLTVPRTQPVSIDLGS